MTCARCNTVLRPAGDPYGTQPPQGRSKLPLIAGLSVMLLIVFIAALVVFRKQLDRHENATDAQAKVVTTTAGPGPATPAQPAGDARAQAAAIDAVLSASVATRRKLNDAIKRIGGCDDLGGAISDMRAVGTERKAQIATVRDADLGALPAGESLRSELVSALQYALKADQGFLGWAEPTTSDGCANTSSRSKAYQAGQDASAQAGAAKRAFLAQWNPVAAANGLGSRSADDI